MPRSFQRYDRIAPLYATNWPLITPGYAPILATMGDVVRALSDRPRTILDLGCGPASATLAVASACHPEATATLVDGSATMLGEALRFLGPHIEASYHGDFTTSGTLTQACTPGRYDLVLCSFALHHLTDIEKANAIEAAANATRPGGLMLLADEIAIDRPGGWDVVERIRGRIVEEHLHSGRITTEFWTMETTHPPSAQLPFSPARVDDLTSWMARAGLAVSCPVSILGSALLIGTRNP